MGTGLRVESVALLLLVGGRSRRLAGIKKHLLVRRDGRRLFERALEVYGPLVDTRAYAAPFGDRNLDEAGLVFVRDAGRGPHHAVVRAAEVLPSSWLFVVPGDQVAPEQSLYRRLRTAAEGQNSVAVVREKELEPLPGLYRCEELRRRNASPDSMRSLVSLLSPATVAFEKLSPDERRAFRDVDTPQDMIAHGLRDVSVFS